MVSLFGQGVNYKASNGFSIISKMICTMVEGKRKKRAKGLLINFTVSPQMLGVLKTRLLKCKHQDLMNNGM